MSKKLSVIFMSVILILSSFSICSATEKVSNNKIVNNNGQKTEIEEKSLIAAYENQNKKVLVIGNNKIEKVNLNNTNDIILGGINDEQKENTEIYVINNQKEGSKTCIIDVPVECDNRTSTVLPMGTGSKGGSKNYARIEAKVKIYYSTIADKDGEVGYRPTKVGGQITYLPNSAVIKSLSANTLSSGNYHTSALKGGFQGLTSSAKKKLSVNNFKKLQIVSVSSPDRYFHCDVSDGTYVAGRYYVSYTLNAGKNSGSFYAQVNI